ncbi:hypothetical protein SNE40_011611 [Patella caerulea]|uniref:Proteasome assembly chaperone 3 n=1 Tax=Patella caerulea TaxID=87958 RepID=A0AAN8JPP2_PATCE
MAASVDDTRSKFPVSTNQVAYEVNGIPSEIVVSQFTDKLFIVVTQYKKIGTVLQINKEVILDEMQQASTVYNIKVLLGKDEPLTHVIAKNLTSEINTNKQIILTVALKDSSPQTVKILKSLIKDCVC